MARTHQSLVVQLVLGKRRHDEPTNFTSDITPKPVKKRAPDLHPGEAAVEISVLEESKIYTATTNGVHHAEVEDVFDEDTEESGPDNCETAREKVQYCAECFH